jgi:hypothetical protein
VPCRYDSFGFIGLRHVHCSFAIQPTEPVKHGYTRSPQ